ncbi:MAG: chemotaxis protein CheD [Limnochordia bacterium]|jgi:chemotaxis protein CheD
MEEFVNIGQMLVRRETGTLIAVGLGSCVGLVLMDQERKVGGMAHVFLPRDKRGEGHRFPGKFAETAIPAMLEEMIALGARRRHITAKMAGGSLIFSFGGGRQLIDVGKQNVEMLQEQLAVHSIPLVASDVLGNKGRKMVYEVATGQVFVSTVGKPPVEL